MNHHNNPKPSRRSTPPLVSILCLLAIAVSISLTFYEINRQRSNNLATAENTLTALSLGLSRQISTILGSAYLLVDDVGNRLENNSTLPPSLSLPPLASTPQIAAVLIIDAQGRLVASSAPAGLTLPTQWEDSNIFTRHRDQPGTDKLLSMPEDLLRTGQANLPVSRRLQGRDGRFLGVVICAIAHDVLDRAMDHALPVENGAFAIFRTDGLLLARTPPGRGPGPGGDFSSTPMLRPDAPPMGLEHGASPIDGLDRIAAYHRLADFPILVTVSVNKDALLTAWTGNTVRLVMAAALLAVAALIGGALLTWQRRQGMAREQALKDSKRRLRFSQFAMDNAGDMVMWVDADGLIFYANHTACRRLGYDADGLDGLPIARFSPRLAARVWNDTPATDAAHSLPSHLRLDADFRTRTGLHFPGEITVNRLEFEGETYICAFVRDIGERKIAEAALADKTARLEASNAELEQFAYVASHDLREPLRMITSFIGLLERRLGTGLDKDSQDFVTFIRDGAIRMDRLIVDLLEYSRVGRLVRPHIAMPLDQPITQAINALGLAIQDKNAVVDIPALPHSIMGDAQELARLFQNLIGNALKYAAPDRRPIIHVGAETQGQTVHAWVQDNGIGIAPADHDRIFGIFQRLHGRDKYEGTGIGLAICKKIAEHHGGRIWVESTLGHGSTFHLSLPLA